MKDKKNESLAIKEKLSRLNEEFQNLEFDNLAEIPILVPPKITEIKECLLKFSVRNETLHKMVLNDLVPSLDKEITNLDKLNSRVKTEDLKFTLPFVKGHISSAIAFFISTCIILSIDIL